MHDLVIHTELAALVIEHKDTNAAAAVVERVGNAAEEAALVEHWETLLDVTSFGHADNAAVLADVKHTILLEDRPKHVLNNNRGGRVGDEA